MSKKSLFIFRRDLRLKDNTGLNSALEKSDTVIPCFIYDKIIQNKFKRSKFRWNFLNESLTDLDEQLHKKNSSLQVFKGIPSQIVKKMVSEHKPDAIFVNTDFTWYAQKRDAEISKICKKNNIEFTSTLDHMLCNPKYILTNEKRPYTVYSSFFKKAKQFPIKNPAKNSKNNYSNENISKFEIQEPSTKSIKISGGRKNALKVLNSLNEFKDYEKLRNFPSEEYTTMLSAHNKFGTVSIREIYYRIKKVLGINHTLISEIFWREFFCYVLFHFPETRTRSFRKKFSKIPWSKSKTKFKKWRDGNTGFPIVDAGMRELNQTGFMHNRVRMIVSSFLTKDLHIDWRWGEQYFAQKLIDYDPAVNVGNWQWAASTGCDAVPYFRIFNPWIQQKRFDPNCEYIKKWIPELVDLNDAEIHNLANIFPNELKYPKPMLDHKTEAKITKQIFQDQ